MTHAISAAAELAGEMTRAAAAEEAEVEAAAAAVRWPQVTTPLVMSSSVVSVPVLSKKQWVRRPAYGTR